MLVSISTTFWTLPYYLALQVYPESWLLCSQLKTDIQVQVQNLKSLFPNSLNGSLEELQSQVRDTVKKWVSDGSYLHAIGSNLVRNSALAFYLSLISPQDKQIHFAHPIIASTAKLFYFNKWHVISTCDHETFNGSVPKPLIALIGAVVSFLSCWPQYSSVLYYIQYRNVLDKWSNGHLSTVKLDSKDYRPVYNGILDAMAIVDDDPIDGPRLWEHLTAWAGYGMYATHLSFPH